MVFAFTWNSAFLALPADTEDESLGAGRIRDTKAAVGERLAVNHSLLGDGNDGKHIYSEYLAQGADPNGGVSIINEGWLYTKYDTRPSVGSNCVELYYLNNNNQITQLTFLNNVNVTSPIPSGTCMAFLQSAVPVGWVQDTTKNDQVIRLNSGVGGGTGGGWTLSGVTIGATTLTVAQMPSHSHTVGPIPNSSAGGNAYAGANNGNAIGLTSGNTGGGQSHTHSFTNDATWRPAYVDAVVGVKQ